MRASFFFQQLMSESQKLSCHHLAKAVKGFVVLLGLPVGEVIAVPAAKVFALRWKVKCPYPSSAGPAVYHQRRDKAIAGLTSKADGGHKGYPVIGIL